MNAYIENKQRKIEAVGRDMANITKDQLLNKIKIGVMLELYQKSIIPATLYGAETWQINKKATEQNRRYPIQMSEENTKNTR